MNENPDNILYEMLVQSCAINGIEAVEDLQMTSEEMGDYLAGIITSTKYTDSIRPEPVLAMATWIIAGRRVDEEPEPEPEQPSKVKRPKPPVPSQ